MVQSKYDRSSGGSTGGDQDNIELKFTPYASFEGDLVTAFGTTSAYGDSLGMVFEDVEITDGVLYLDSDKELLKLFSWEQSTGFSIVEAYERGEEPDIDDAPERLAQTYGDTKKRYELVGAVIEPITDGDEVVVEGASKVRDFEFNSEPEFGEFEDLGGDPISIDRDVITWKGSSDDGPTAAATRFASLVTEYGPDVVRDDESLEWLADTTGDNILREDLDGRRVEVFLTEELAEESGRTWYRPTIIDVKTGSPVSYNNADEGDSGN